MHPGQRDQGASGPSVGRYGAVVAVVAVAVVLSVASESWDDTFWLVSSQATAIDVQSGGTSAADVEVFASADARAAIDPGSARLTGSAYLDVPVDGVALRLSFVRDGREAATAEGSAFARDGGATFALLDGGTDRRLFVEAPAFAPCPTSTHCTESFRLVVARDGDAGPEPLPVRVVATLHGIGDSRLYWYDRDGGFEVRVEPADDDAP